MDAMIAQLIGAGPMGIFVAYLIWERREDRKAAGERVAADKELAAALAALTVVVRGTAG